MKLKSPGGGNGKIVAAENYFYNREIGGVITRAMFACLSGGVCDEENWRWPWNRRWTAGDRSDRNGTGPAPAVRRTAERCILRRASGPTRSGRTAGPRRTPRAGLRTSDEGSAVERRRISPG